MRGALAIVLLLCGPALLRADPAPAQVWIEPGDAAIAAAARSALTAALTARGRQVHEVTTPLRQEAGIADELKRALDAYLALHLEDARASLLSLSTVAQRLGGADLDTHALADLYLYLALCEQELGANDAAWESLVSAVRIDPSRALDPARIPPRATVSHRRAQLELAQLTPVELELRLPTDARARIDGDEGHAPGLVGRRFIPGPHFVRVDAPGFQPYRGMVTLTAAREIFAPNLRPLEAPAFTAAPDAVGARVERIPEGWQLALRGHTAGMSLEASALIRPDTAGATAERLATQVLGPVPRRTPVWKRWWVWTIAGAAAAAIVIAVPVAVTTHHGTIPSSAGGALEPLR